MPSTKDADSKRTEQKTFLHFSRLALQQQRTQSITVVTVSLATSQYQHVHCRPALTDSENLPCSTSGWVPGHLLKGESMQGEAWGHQRIPGGGEAGWSDAASRGQMRGFLQQRLWEREGAPLTPSCSTQPQGSQQWSRFRGQSLTLALCAHPDVPFIISSLWKLGCMEQKKSCWSRHNMKHSTLRQRCKYISRGLWSAYN